MDVAGPVEEEEPGPAEGVMGPSRNLEDADVVVAGLELGEDFHVLREDAVVLGFGLGLLEGGCVAGGAALLVLVLMLALALAFR